MCFEDRKSPVNCITLFSVVVAICGIIMAVFAYLLTSSDVLDKLKDTKKMSDLDDIQSSFAAGLFAMSAFIILLSVLGFCFRCCKHPCYAWIYGCTMFPVWLVLFILGGIAVSVAMAGDDDLVKYCNELDEEIKSGLANEDNLIEIGLDIYSAVRIDEYMCT